MVFPTLAIASSTGEATLRKNREHVQNSQLVELVDTRHSDRRAQQQAWEFDSPVGYFDNFIAVVAGA